MEKTKILIVEDNPIVAMDLETKLIDMGYEVTATAYSGEKALESVKVHLPDIALMDIRLGAGITGIETASELKSKYNISVIYLTAHADCDTISRAKITEPYGYIVKPFDNNQLKSVIDIAVFKQQADRKRSESQQWLKTTLNSIGDGVIATDNEGKIMFMNPVASDLTEWSEADVVGKPMDEIFKIINEDTLETVESPVAKVLLYGKIVGLANHTLLITKSGKKIPIADSGAPIKNDKGVIVGVVLVFRDQIQERKVEKYRELNEARLETLVKLGQMNQSTLKEISDFALEQAVVLTKSKIGYLAYMNESETILSMYSWSKSAMKQCEIINKPIDYPIEQTGLWGEAVRQRKVIITNDYSAPNPSKKGLPKGHVPLQRHVNIPVFDGDKIVAVAGVGNKQTDYDDSDVRQLNLLMQGMWTILKRQRSEKELRKSEGQLRAIFDAAKSISFIITDAGDPEPLITEFSPGAEKIFGYTKSEMIGKPVSIVHLPEDVEKFPDAIKQLKKGKVGFSGKTHLVRKSGELFSAIYSSYPLLDEKGEMYAGLGVSIDLSEQEKLEAKLRHSDKMVSIGNLAGGIAHDFNNILSSIIGFSELAISSVEKGTTLEDDLQEIQTAGHRAKDLVKQILTFARKSEEKIVPIRPSLIAKEVLNFLRSSIPTDIEIKHNLKSDSSIMGDATQVHQVFMNLCTNAAHSMEEKGGVLEISLQDLFIENGELNGITDLKSGHYVEIKISDMGIGISNDIIETIFEPYFTTKGPGEGTGMGLAVVHGIIENYKGDISVKSELGKGTSFTILLPISEKCKPHVSHESPPMCSGTERVLLVDDEVSITKIGDRILGKMGYQVTSKNSSVDSLELFKKDPEAFDLVITDMTMPIMTGDKLAIEILKIRPDIPIIMCTGYSKKITDETAKKIGIKAFEFKPIVHADLLKTIREVLDKSHSQLI